MEQSSPSLLDILYSARQLGVEFILKDGKLQIKLEEGSEIDPSFLEEIRNNKESIIEYLNNEAWRSKQVDSDFKRINVTDRAAYENYPLSFSQERLWFIDRLEGSVQYHIPTVLRLKGKLNIDALKNSIQSIINRHEVLRTVIREDSGTGFQVIKEKDSWQLEIIDGKHLYKKEKETQNLIKEIVNTPFNLSEDYMIRVKLLHLGEAENILVVALHHIASDAWSTGILVKEFVELYNAFDSGKAPSLPLLEAQYADYAIWQRNYLQGEVLDKKIDYWKQKLEGTETLHLHLDKVRPAVQSSNGSTINFKIGKELTEKLNVLVKQSGTTRFMTLLAAFKILFSRYSRQQDICIGTPVAGRHQKEVESLIGFFINSLALRSDVSGDLIFREFLQQVRQTTLEAYENQEVPFEKVVDAVVKERDMSRNPLFQIMFGFQNIGESSKYQLGELELINNPSQKNASQFDLTISINEIADGMGGAIIYCTDLFHRETVQRMVTQYLKLLDSIVQNPETRISDLKLITPEESNQIINDFNKPFIGSESKATIITLFEDIVKKYPNARALVFEDEELTYKDLNEKSNQFANYLRKKGVGNESLVPVCIARGMEMVIAILGILKAGGAYVPIDPEYPVDRILYTLDEINAEILVTGSLTNRELFRRIDIEHINPSLGSGEFDNEGKEDLNVDIKPGQLAYLIFTSGSTGKPKGVMIEHRGVVNLATGQKQLLNLEPQLPSLQFASFSFDASCYEIFNTLLSGGCLVLCNKNDINTAGNFETLIDKYDVELATLPSSFLQAVKDNLGKIKTIVSAGEKLNTELAGNIQNKGIRLINAYGPTETTVCASLTDSPLTADGKVSIGKPVPNLSIYITDPSNQLCPIGMPGEIWVSGVQVARGYLNRPELTKEKFIEDPFSKQEGQRLYKTGDLGCWLPDGNIEFVGRIDEQVKIRGFRIEPGEIENAIKQSGLVEQSMVLIRDDNQGNAQLVAFVVSNEQVSAETMKEYLKSSLPDFMIPDKWIVIENFPVTPSGKVDKKALLSLSNTDLQEGGYVPPQNETQEKLVEIWQDILEVDKVGIRDDFFELGGHSILAIRLVSAFRKVFDIEIQLTEVFDYPTIELFAERLNQPSENSSIPSITKNQTRPERIPLSFSQERLWFIDKLEGSVQYHIPSVLRLKGDLDIKALENAIGKIVERHEVLRTVILENEGEGYQFIRKNEHWVLPLLDDPLLARPEKLKQHLREFTAKPFDLSNDDMLRAELIRLGKQEYIFVVTLHHIVSDGWSNSIIVKELVELYNASIENRQPDLLALPVQYADYAIWQRNYLKDELLENKLNYWKNKLSGITPLELPTDFTRPRIQSNNGASVGLAIDKQLTDHLSALGQQTGATLFMTILAAFKVLLYRHTGQQDISVGTPVAGRHQQELEALIGFFINTIVLRDEVDEQSPFREFLAKLRVNTMEAFEHQDVPFEKIVEAADVERDMSRSPLFQVLFVYQNTPDVPALRLGNVSLTAENISLEKTKFDITFSASETSGGMNLSIQYCTDLYTKDSMDRMLEHLEILLRSIAENPEQKIGELPIMSRAEQDLIVETFNDNKVDYAKNKTIISLFEEQAQKTPDNTALVYEDRQLSYKQLNERANQLAHYLVQKGVKQETLVPLCLERGLDMITGILGILKAGGAYVPIDPEYPQDRITYMLEDTAGSVVLSSSKSKHKTGEGHFTLVEMDTDWNDIAGQPNSNPKNHTKSDNLAYVIYTSGSTGKPKGVMIEHAGVVNLIKSQTDYFNISSEERILQFSHYSFDASVEQIFLALSNGASLIMFEESLLLDSRAMENFIKEQRVTHVHATPGMLENLNPGEYSNLQRVIAGGDLCKRELAERWSGKVDFYNEYGPTETTVTAIEYKDDKSLMAGNKPYPIGKGLTNVDVYILSKQNQLQPLGVAGEINIGGIQVARGYLNNNQLTGEKFINNHLSKEKGGRLYKTGDLARWLPDGNIEYLGRMDEQVKIRGYRIELGEIESVLQQNDLVKQSVVLAKEDKEGQKRLVGYIVLKEESGKEKVINQLKTLLPEFMVPGLWVIMDSLPLTPNGKIDRKALPDPDLEERNKGSYVAPGNNTEQILASLWEELLHLEKAGIHDNFFESGGHSLLAMRLVSAIRMKLEADVSVKDLFIHPTIRELSLQLKGPSLPSIQKQDYSSPIPLSFSQERLWFIDRLEGSIQYHVPIILKLKGWLNIPALNYALQEIINRHMVLKTVFRETDGKICQVMKESVVDPLKVHETGVYKDDPDSLKREIQKLVFRPFDLSSDLMMRSDLIKLGEDSSILVVTMHHIASDAWSLPILIKEVVELYSAFTENRAAKLDELPLQYFDYSLWQRTYLDGEVLNKKLDYWKQKLDGIRPLELPTDFKRPPVRGIRGASLGTKVDKDLLADIYTLNQQQGTTLYMSLLAAFQVLLYRYSGQEDISVGASITNRPQQELENLVGFFVNTLTLRSQVKPDASFRDFLQSVKTTTIEAYEHQDVPFEKIVEVVVKERDPSRSPLFQVLLVLINTPEKSKPKFGDVEIIPQAFDNNISKFDISLHVSESSSGLNISVEYSTDLYMESTIAAMMEHYKAILSEVAANPGRKISEISMLSEPETRQLTTGFNTSEVIVPKEISLPTIFATHASKSPNSNAVVFEDKKLSYSELDQRANQLAHALNDAGVKPGTLVPLYMDRGIDMIAAILGIMKAGCAYVPIDRDFPKERIEFIIEDTAAKFVVCDRIGADDIGYLDVKVISMEHISGFDKDAPAYKIKPQDPAYVIYTSGSTGKPKGVIITHHNLTDYIYGLHSRLDFGNCRSFALVSSIATDLGNTVIFSSWFNAGVLHLFSKQTVSDAHSICQYFDQHPIDCLKIVPSHWKALCTDSEMLLPKSLLIFGGELLEAAVVQSIQQRSGVTIVNHYGPTETTIGKLLHEVQNDRVYDRTIPIGTPFGNTAVYVISPDKQLCPKGVPGELFIGGDGLAKAYLNLPQLTLERFIDNPYKKGQKIYATGDLVKYNQQGEIEYLGRTDDQVKIRGYRIELGEIETAIAQSNLVQQAVVLLKLSPEGSPRLTAYILTVKGYQKQDLLDELKLKLPEYMIPSLIMELESFPLLANGKVDRKALPDPDTDQSTGQYIAPRDQTEEVMAELWQEILEVDKVGMSDDFFELGGHSLLAIRLVSAIRKAFEVEMPIGDIFDYPTIGQLAERIAEQSGSTVLPPITKNQTRPERIPLSFSQERLWFIDKLEGSVQYHIPSVLRLKGDLDIKALENAIGKIVERHEVLRTVILENEGEGYQFIRKNEHWVLPLLDDPLLARPEKLKQHLREFTAKPFDLSNDDMLRAELIRLGKQEYIFVVTLHHIVSDGWSNSIIVKELVELYNASIENRQPDLLALPVQYADYAIWQRNYLKDELLENKLNYWKNKLSGITPLELPTDLTRPRIQSNNGASVGLAIDKQLTDHLSALGQQTGATLFMTILAAFKVLLYRHTGQQDISVGTPVAGRHQQELEALIGFFINTIVLRDEVDEQSPFREFLAKLRVNTMEAFEHQDVPFEKIVEAADVERDMSRSPLFQVLFVYQNTPDVPALRLGNVSLTAENISLEKTKFDITFSASETSGGMNLSIQYCTDLYTKDSMDRMLEHLEILLRSIAENPEQKIGELPIMSRAEQDLIVETFNDNHVDYPKNKTIISLFEEQAQKTPDNTALVYEDRQLSYKQLNERANQLAHYLVQKGVKQGTLVPFCLERGLDMITGILGILKAGGAYVPIDPEYPQDRITYMLEDTAGSVVLSSSKSKHKTGEGHFTLVEMDTDWNDIAGQPISNPKNQTKADNLAYVIYTSGSTGKPKGVMIEHGNVYSFISWCLGEFSHKSFETAYCVTSICFDLSVYEIFYPLICGKKIRILESSLYLGKYLSSDKNVLLNCVPSVAENLLREETDLTNIKVLNMAGEPIGSYLTENLDYESMEIRNLYGPTEDTTYSTVFHLEKNKPVTIGKPISNTQVRILDRLGKPVPLRVAGEIYLGGSGIARGYLNKHELTQEKFIDDPFSKNRGARLYRTGDLGRWLNDGNIEFLGRMDDQVKVRGFRIELGEIESVIQTSGLVKQSVILAKHDIQGNKRLVAYIVSVKTFDKTSLLTHLKAQLPDYMIPALWVELKELPMTPNGKIDKKALPDPEIDETQGQEYVAPGNDTEEKLVEIWHKLLNREKISVHDNFFELGGNSLMALRIISAIRRVFDVEVEIVFLVSHPTISGLAEIIHKLKENPDYKE